MATAEADIQKKIRKDKESSEESSENYSVILDESVSAKKENEKIEQIKKSSEEDLESLLKLAEDLKNKTENNFNRKFLIFYRLLQISVVVLFSFSLYFSYSDYRAFERLEIEKILVLLVCIALILYLEFEIRNIKKELLPDKLALKEVLQLLREVHGTIAEREDWSILKRAEFRIRLSRFDLSEKKDSVFSFFS